MRDEEFVLPGASGAVSFPAGASFRSKGAIGRASTKFFPSRRETTALGLLTAASIVFVAGILRGMTGFGFALVAAIGLAHVWPPAMATPVVLLLELVVAVVLLYGLDRAAIEPRRLVRLCLGGVAGTAIGTLMVSGLPAAWAKPALDTAVFVSALAALAHVSAPRLDTPAWAAAVGFLVGLFAGAFAVGGPFVVVWFLAVGAQPAAIRANLIVFFAVVDFAAVAFRWPTIGIPADAWGHAAMLLPPAFLGTWAGGLLFRRVNAAWWRRIAAYSIAGGAVLSLARSLLS